MVILWLGSWPAQAGVLADRVAHFPQWEKKPVVSAVVGDDLVYPTWMAGTWNVTSTLVEMTAPWAPKLRTPGFAGNREYLEKPIQFRVRFHPQSQLEPVNFLDLTALFPFKQKSGNTEDKIVADREFNGLNIGKAMLGEDVILKVQVDPRDINRQTTELTDGRELVSVVTQRGSEIPREGEFIATEITQQVFRGQNQIYFNEVETTTVYQLKMEEGRHIVGDQMTAIYLSPQDPQYFIASGRPVALYRYQLELWPG